VQRLDMFSVCSTLRAVPYVGRVDFNYRVILWDGEGVRIVREPAGVDDMEMAIACWEIAVTKHPGERITLQQGAKVIGRTETTCETMCGLVRVRSKEHPFVSDTRVETLFHDADAKPSQELPVFRRHPETGVPVEGKLRWGLIPHWIRTRPEIQPINARAESIREKKMFSDAYAKRRCIVPMDAFYERDRRRRLYAFSMKDGQPFGVAGIWENWHSPDDAWERTFCIITVPPNTLVGQVHDRMPAIIPINDHLRWLGPESDPYDLLAPYPAEQMMMRPC